MTRFSFGHCQHCGRLNIYGARCVCQEPKPIDCDCKTDGNRQIIGPKCQQRIHDAWTATIKWARGDESC